MVKIQTRIITKKYRDKVYSYKQHIVLLPLPCSEELAPFLDQQLDLKIQDDALILALRKPMEKPQDGERN
jgi:hypothetical protein